MRFIPARAGNTLLVANQYGLSPVHPRASGEHYQRRYLSDRARGSSPRERGTQHPYHDADALRRFIPARAGNTMALTIGMMESPVHPRASGEHDIAGSVDHDNGGSSPRERGTPLAASHPSEIARFIPARAGNTSPATTS